MSALAIGLLAGVLCYLMVAHVKARLGYDDSLDAFGVHGVGGTIGALLTGVFASRAINPIFKDAQGNALASGVIDGNPGQLLNHATISSSISRCLTAVAFAATRSFFSSSAPESSPEWWPAKLRN